MTPSLEELETDLTPSPLSRGPEPWAGLEGAPGSLFLPLLIIRQFPLPLLPGKL